LLNNTKYDGINPDESTRTDFTAVTSGVPPVTAYYSELPTEGETEIWEIVNITADAHPIHLHLVQFQLINRQKFDAKGYNAIYNGAFPGGGIDPMTGLAYLPGVLMPAYGPPLDYNGGNPRALGGNPDITPFLSPAVNLPELNERGWKDTVIMFPGEVTRIAVRYAPTDRTIQDPNALGNTLYYPFIPNGGHGYVWHCHIIDHEDNEMMRPKQVQPKSVTRTYTDY
ncbi:MAG: multicopper oxidase domain-containing protein, partial [Candidatus Methanoperedens sp.]|nr:multicopper oxidase domain-containing protein [Candidatus Methanoperedens sp.]